MKKILLVLSGLCIAFQGMAQYNEATQFVIEKTPVNEINRFDGPIKQTKFKKLRGQRYYSYISSIDAVDYGGVGTALANPGASPIWFDSTIRQRFSTGYGAINYTSFAGAIRPAAALFNNPAAYSGEMHIDANQPYTVDSIIFWGIYMNSNNTGAITNDKLKISVVKTGDNNTTVWSLGKTNTPSIASNYLNPVASTDTLIRGIAPTADSVNKIGGRVGNPRVTWDYTLTNSDTSARSSTGSYRWKRFAFAPPSPINVPAGEIVVASITFQSGATWVPNVDSVSFDPGAGAKAHFRARFYEENNGALMTYRENSDRFGGADFCNSSSMFSTFPSRYLPAVLVESFNSPAVSNEHLDVDWVLSCAACGPVATKDISKEFHNISIYPNPTTSDLSIRVDEVRTSDMFVTVYSITGMKLATTVIAKGNTTATIDFANQPSGIYLCELEIDGQKHTQKITKQ